VIRTLALALLVLLVVPAGVLAEPPALRDDGAAAAAEPAQPRRSFSLGLADLLPPPDQREAFAVLTEQRLARWDAPLGRLEHTIRSQGMLVLPQPLSKRVPIMASYRLAAELDPSGVPRLRLVNDFRPLTWDDLDGWEKAGFVLQQAAAAYALVHFLDTIF
jgi:hypothetical protein